MKKPLTLLLAISLLLGACKNAAYLPEVKELGTELYGAELDVRYKISENNRESAKGELLCVEPDALYLLLREPGYSTTLRLEREALLRYKVNIAMRENLYALLGIALPVSLTHGFFGIVSGVVNVMIITALSERKLHNTRFRSSDIPYEELHLYARFPAGFPPNISAKDFEN